MRVGRGLTAVGSAAAVVTAVGSATAVVVAAQACLNLVLLRRPPTNPPPSEETVCVIIPARDEARRIGACLARVLAQQGVPRLQVVVVDDASSDGTAAVVRAVAGGDPRVHLFAAPALPPGWRGKPHACAHGAAACPDAEILVFLDADVALAPHALAAAVAQRRQLDVGLLSPFPRQHAGSPAEHLIQPLLAWSWLGMVPLRWSERSRRGSLAVACGQFLVLDAAAYARAGGHAGVRGEVIEDLALARAVRRSGGRTAVTDGSSLADCRMYEGWADLREGYTKSMWSAFGSPVGALAAHVGMTTAYVLPAVAALFGSPVGLAGYLAGVTGRAVVARRTGSTMWPALTHPLASAVTTWVTLESVRRRRRGHLTWKGRSV